MKSSTLYHTFGVLFLAASGASASPVVDGTINPSDGYGSPIKTYVDQYINGTDSSSGTNTVSTYWAFDAVKVYGAIHLDSGTAAIPGANVYVYSSNANTSTTTGLPGVYGDGDDLILEGSNGWVKALNAPPWAGPHQAYNAATVDYVYNGSNTIEFSIDRSIIGDYSSFRYGGQLFAYEFHTGSGDRIPGAIAAVPEPTSLALLGFGVISLLTRKRRKALS